MVIRKADKCDASAIAELAVLMWEDNSVEDLAEELAAVIDSADGVIYLLTVDGKPAGFAQCQLRRDYVEGTDSSPVGYLEGIFVSPEYRRCGYAKKLLAECEQWAREKGCREFASDCELTNQDSLAFHLHMGFTEANRIVCFTRKL